METSISYPNTTYLWRTEPHNVIRNMLLQEEVCDGHNKRKIWAFFLKIKIFAHILLIFCPFTAFYAKITENLYYMSNFATET